MSDVDTRPEKLSLVASIIGLFILVCGILLGRQANCTAMTSAWLAGMVTLVLALVAFGRRWFARHQAEEKVHFEDYKRMHESAELFDESDEAVKLAARANQHYVKYFVPVVTVLVGAVILFAGSIFWTKWNKAIIAPMAEQPLSSAVLAFGLCLAGIIAGSFYMGVSREKDCRWLRPSAAWLFFTAFLFLLSAIVLLGEHFGWSIQGLDSRIAKFSMTLLMVLGVELTINFIIEFYRPRSLGEEDRPLFESRILSLVTEPGGIARNVAVSLDYQFGFRVSEFWFYRFIERTVIPFSILATVVFWLQTCVVVVQTEENGVRERFGAVVSETPLPPGIYAKLPSPFGRIFKFPVERVQQLPIGYVPGSKDSTPDMNPEMQEMQGDLTGRVIVWSKFHNKDEISFVVASEPDSPDDQFYKTDSPDDLPVNVYFMSASIPLFFKVKNLYDYAYRHRDPLKTLSEMAHQEVVRYLAKVDFFTILTAGRSQGAVELAENIQKAADQIKLGIDVVFVGLQGLHPPVMVGASFDEVVGAMEEKHEAVLKGEQYAIRTEPAATGEALTRITRATAYKNERIRVAEAEAQRFNKQLLAYDASPSLFVLNSFLDVLENEGGRARKFVVATKDATEVFVINLEKKLRPDLLDLDINREE